MQLLNQVQTKLFTNVISIFTKVISWRQKSPLVSKESVNLACFCFQCLRTNATSPMVGKRSLTDCRQCCQDDFCNTHCSQSSAPLIGMYMYVCMFVCLFVCLFVLLLYVAVNSYGHGRTVSSFNPTFSWASLNKRYFSHIGTCMFKQAHETLVVYRICTENSFKGACWRTPDSMA